MEYYYLVTSLADIELDSGMLSERVQDFLEQTADWIQGDDRLLFDRIRFPADNSNLVHLMSDEEDAFDNRGSMDKETLTNVLLGRESGPAHMEAFLQAKRENRVLYTGLDDQDTLAWLLMEESDVHPNAFIRTWSEFDAGIRNVLVGLNARNLGKDVSNAVIGRDDVALAVLKSSAQDFGLSQAYPWVDSLLSSKSLLEREKVADRIRWEYLDHQRTIHHFRIETIMAFTLQFFMAERWMGLDETQGRKMLEELVGNLSENANGYLPANL